jgi:hypothetical protein
LGLSATFRGSKAPTIASIASSTNIAVPLVLHKSPAIAVLDTSACLQPLLPTQLLLAVLAKLATFVLQDHFASLVQPLKIAQ